MACMFNIQLKIVTLVVVCLFQSAKDPSADRSERGTPKAAGKARDKTRVITFRVPHNAAVQVSHLNRYKYLM